MPRRARRKGTSGYHHVVVRGNGKQVLFEKTEDFRFYLRYLEKYSTETRVGICAYCLMPNHVHLLLHDDSGQMAAFMQKLGVTYSGYYNQKYDHVGHVFQSRYHNEPIESDRAFLCVFRYILQNPEKAGIAPASRYRWNSFDDYALPVSFLDLSLIREKLPKEDDYKAFLSIPETHSFSEGEVTRISDKEANVRIFRELGVSSGVELGTWDKERRNEAIRKLKKAGLSIRQIARATGIGRNIVERAVEEKEQKHDR